MNTESYAPWMNGRFERRDERRVLHGRE